ncbi:MAG: ABC transporter permease, partial [Gaiellaceae bacterium]
MTSVALEREEQRWRVTQPRVLLSEWTKLRSLRSTRYSLLAAWILTIGVSILGASVISAHWGSRSPADRAHFHPLDVSLIGSEIAQLAIGVLGVLVLTGEYSTGQIRSSFMAVPKRLPVLWAK